MSMVIIYLSCIVWHQESNPLSVVLGMWGWIRKNGVKRWHTCLTFCSYWKGNEREIFTVLNQAKVKTVAAINAQTHGVYMNQSLTAAALNLQALQRVAQTTWDRVYLLVHEVRKNREGVHLRDSRPKVARRNKTCALIILMSDTYNLLLGESQCHGNQIDTL